MGLHSRVEHQGQIEVPTTFLGLQMSSFFFLYFISSHLSHSYYCVSRRCPTSFWILTSETNKLPVDNAFDYYNHDPHNPPTDYNSEIDDNFFTGNETTNPVEAQALSHPRVAAYKSRMSWLIKDFTKYLVQFTSFVVTFGKPNRQWKYYNIYNLCYFNNT